MTMPTYHITIADRIKAYRNENDLTLKEFGMLIGVSAQAVYKWVRPSICHTFHEMM